MTNLLEMAEKSNPGAETSPVSSPENDSAIGQFTSNAWGSFKHSLLQNPVNGVVQLSDRTFGTDLLPHVQFVDPVPAAEGGSAGWWGQAVGSTVGTALPLIAMYKFMGPGAGSKLQLSQGFGLGRVALPIVEKSALIGAGYAGILQPVSEKEDFWQARVRNTVVGGLTGATLTAAGIGIKSAAITGLKNDVAVGALSGLPAGIVNANSHSLLSGRGLASLSENIETTALFVTGGALIGGMNSLHEMVKPTSGIRGVRTWEDINKLADSTKLKNAGTLRGTERIADPSLPNTGKVYRSAFESLKGQPLSAEQKNLIARGQQDLVHSLEHIGPNRPVVTIYGSARTPESAFPYQRTRYTAGMLAKDGWTVMTGGGEKGIMRAANQGAFESGGKSIGVNIELPFEQRPNPFQNISITHKNFFTRKQALRTADAFIVEQGGIGTLDEAAEVLTHLQTKMMQGTPVYFVGSKNYGPLKTLFQQFQSNGTISPGDMKLFKIVDDPNIIIRELSALKAGMVGKGASTSQSGASMSELIPESTFAPARIAH
ncbi:MAG: TIGR00730 family Rossman fold protein [Candidatus Obscuribacterales bacterium]|nr:TIGR00730 family Rossman fold protein [Candidatus Obscuribacterales bacterium]